LLLLAGLYLWTAGSTYPLAFRGQQADPYNQLASAFAHFHLSVGAAPAALLRLRDPYEPSQNIAFQSDALGSIHDFALYRGRLFITWGPVPALFLIPLHMIGLEPSSSATAALFAIAGLTFVLATLRILLRQLGDPALWMCILAAFTLGLASAVPFMLRRPAAYEDAISAGLCFAMAGTWLAISTLAGRRTARWRLILMSLCFGLAAGSRPTLALAAVLLVPVYRSMRPNHARASLLVALIVPVCACLLLLLAYNQARFGNPLEVGVKYQLAGYDARTARFSDLSYVLPGAWSYLITPPRPAILFPFLVLSSPSFTYPFALPAHYMPIAELTGGLLPMAPIVLFLAALPWIWLRRPALLGPLGPPLMLMAGIGIAVLLFLSYEIFSATERYVVDFSTLLLFGAVGAWLAISCAARGLRRRVVRIGGGCLAAWACLTGLAVSFVGYYNLLERDHPGTWATLEDAGSPLSTAIVELAGHPLLASLSTPSIQQHDSVSSSSLGTSVTSFSLGADQRAHLTIVSPDDRQGALVADAQPGAELAARARYGVTISGPGSSSFSQTLPKRDGALRLPVMLTRGIDHFTLAPYASALARDTPPGASHRVLLTVTHFSLVSRG